MNSQPLEHVTHEKLMEIKRSVLFFIMLFVIISVV